MPDESSVPNIYSQVGLVTLVGLVSKNGILIVQFANSEQVAGRSKLEAIREACRIRFRPIMMTMAATVAGHFPLTLVEGPGAAARNSIGLVLVGGMTIGTIFTLFILPCVYILLARDHSKDLPKMTVPDAALAPATNSSSSGLAQRSETHSSPGTPDSTQPINAGT